MKKLLLLLALATAAHAQTSLVVHTVSQHFSGEQNLNGFNPGFGVRYQQGWLAFQGGAFRNSHRRTSVYAVVDWQPLTLAGLSLGAFAGTVSGYPYRGGAFIPAAGLVTNLRVRRLDVRLRFIPAYRNVSAATLSLEIGRLSR